MVKTNKQNWPFYKKRKIGAFISLVLLIIEIVFAYKFFNNINTDCYIMLLPTAYMIFINLNEIHSLKINLNICASLRKLSTIIYIWQFEWIFIIRNILELFFDTVNSVVLFFLVLFALLVTGVAIIILSENKKWKWLNNAY